MHKRQRKFYVCVAPSDDFKHYDNHNFMVVSFTSQSYQRTAILLGKDHKVWVWKTKSSDLSDNQKLFAPHFNDAEAFRDWLWDTEIQSEINKFLNQIGTSKLQKSHPHLFGIGR